MSKKRYTLIGSFLIILLPMVYGLSKYAQLPSKMATHFDLNNTPNGFMPKFFAVVGLPILMALIQATVLFSSRSEKNKDRNKRFYQLIIWLIPVLSGVVYLTTIFFNLGYALNIGKIAIVLIGFMFIAMGNFLPTLTQGNVSFGFHLYPKSEKAWRKVRRPFGFVMLIGGLALLFSTLAAPLVSALLIVAIVVALLVIGVLANWYTK